MDFTVTWSDPTSYETGSTAFGQYLSLSLFQTDAVKVAKFVSRKLGYPIVNILITPAQVYNCFLLAINQYQTIIHLNIITNSLIDVTGLSKSIDFTLKNINTNIKNSLSISRQYGNYLDIGKDTVLYSASILLKADQQVYSIALSITSSAEVVSVLHFPPNYAGMLTNPFVSDFSAIDADLANGYGIFGLNTTMLMMTPIHDVLLRMQAILFNQTIRRSGYKFDLIGDQLRIYPAPKLDTTLWIIYKTKGEYLRSFLNQGLIVTNAANMKLLKMKYADINLPGKNWIYKYTLALAKLVLGIIRSKYSLIPIADGNTTTDGDTLRNLGKELQKALILQLNTYIVLSNVYSNATKKAKLAEDSHLIRKRIPYKAAISLG